jgi:hypothetical protein
MNELGKALLIIGLIVAALGALLWSGFGKGWLGQLPGDVQYGKGNFRFFFPLTTCLLVSLLLTFLFWLFRGR